ncbi:MAG TPA: hypothetical protein VG675_17170 [Bryobacteraceae bacterium]|nr:hypothetical protein [Bryobacteraceae bacterium]
MRALWITLTVVAVLALAAVGVDRLWPRRLDVRPTLLIPVWERSDGRDVLTLPGRFLVAEISTYDDEFFAYLMFSYFGTTPDLKDTQVLLTYQTGEGELHYAVQLLLPNDLLSSLSLLNEVHAEGLIGEPSWRYVTTGTLDRLRYQTHLFLTAYSLPGHEKLEDLTRPQLVAYIRRFVRFKSLTDKRTRSKSETAPEPLTSDEAHQLAEDIVSVADFYSLPLDFFLGIGAMENNYMNVEGDLQHAIWKRRAQPGDVVLKRRRGRVLVVNSSLGVWQITRETLRYAHKLYLKDTRDYSLLPERLRPPKELDFTHINPEVLTTYAGLLFRDLLDRCGGDVAKAVGAYNGGIRNPNPKYAEGVATVAEYARRVMEHAAVLNGPAAGRQFLAAGP